MNPFEIRTELLKLAAQILQEAASNPGEAPSIEMIIAAAEKLNVFVSQKG